MDWMDEANAYRDLIMTNIEYDILCERYGEERMDEVVELMLEAVISKRPYIRIAGDEFPREIVKSRLLKVGPLHVEYVFDCIDRNTTKVGNINFSASDSAADTDAAGSGAGRNREYKRVFHSRRSLYPGGNRNGAGPRHGC